MADKEGVFVEILFETPNVIVRRSEEGVTLSDKRAGREISIDPVQRTVTILGGEGRPVLQYSRPA